jgi:hypothetical protein
MPQETNAIRECDATKRRSRRDPERRPGRDEKARRGAARPTGRRPDEARIGAR